MNLNKHQRFSALATTFLLLAFLLTGNRLLAQQQFFDVVANQQDRGEYAVKPSIKKYALLHLQENALRQYLAAAPLEFQQSTGLPLEIPLPDGSTEIFSIVESPLLSPEQAVLHPEIKTYTGQGTRHPERVIRFSLTSNGFGGILLNVKKDVVYFEKSPTGEDLYLSYFVRDCDKLSQAPVRQCGEHDQSFTEIADQRTPLQNYIAERNNTGGTLRTYRLAIAGNEEFTALYGNNINNAYSAIVNYANNMAAVYRVELCISFQLVSGTNVVYSSVPVAGDDPYDNDDQGAMLDENQDNLDMELGSAAYDIGHVLGYTGGSGGGVAFAESVCYNPWKGSGVSGIGDINQYPQVFFDQLIYHEVGHQFGMSHSYNSSIPVCTTREPATSVEPGAGATIMSYGFTCGSDDYESNYLPILQFHTVNYEQAYNYVTNPSPGFGGCSTNTSTGNNLPVVTPPANKTIPASTPFSLTGSATDADGDALTYCWEGTNIGTETPTSGTLGNTAKAPFFRSYEPSSSGTRIYPLLEAILDASYYRQGDKLPSIGTTTTHRLTVRDNDASGGSTVYSDVTVTIDGGSGPFFVYNLGGPYSPNSSQTIAWNVANSTAAPVSCANVDILLSTDDGQTFPTTLLANTPNDGSQSVTLPNINTSTARIMVKASDNIFFDISNTFEIQGALPVTFIRFEARLETERNALLDWQTAAESNNQGFEVEMASGNTFQFRNTGFVSANTSGYYHFTVPNLTDGLWYFRLKQVDHNGNSSYSPVRALTVGKYHDQVVLYPNPTEDIVHIQLFDVASSEVQIRIINELGQVVESLPSTPVSENIPVSLQHLAAGNYWIEVQTDASRQCYRLIKR